MKNASQKHRNTVCQSKDIAAVLREDGGDVVKFKEGCKFKEI